MESDDPRARRNDWWRPAPYQPHLRVSDAERHEIADLLSKHFADGRLDDVEFNERLDKAMSAKTRGDLAGLLSDLPRPDLPPPSPTRSDHDHHRWWRIGVLAAAILVIANLATYSLRPHFPLLLVVVLVVVVVSRRRRGWRHHPGSSGP